MKDLINSNDSRSDIKLKGLINSNISRSMLKLKGLELESSGVYRVRVENEFEVKWENFTLIVTEPPQVCIYVHCTILDYADIRWYDKNHKVVDVLYII